LLNPSPPRRHLQLDEAVVQSLRHWDHPLYLGRGPLRRLVPDERFSYCAGGQIRRALVQAMERLVSDLEGATDIDSLRVRTYVQGLLDGRSDRQIGKDLGLSRQSVNSSVRWQAAAAIAELLASSHPVNQLQGEPVRAQPFARKVS